MKYIFVFPLITLLSISAYGNEDHNLQLERLHPRSNEEIIERSNFNQSLNDLAPDASHDTLVLKLEKIPLPLTLTEALENNFINWDQKLSLSENLQEVKNLQDILDLSDILYVPVDDSEARLMADVVKTSDTFSPDEIHNPWKIIDNQKGFIFDLQSHFLKVVSRDSRESVVIPIASAIKMNLISVREALGHVESDLRREIGAHNDYLSQQETKNLQNIRVRKYEKTIKYFRRPDVLPLKFTLNAYGNEIVGDFDTVDQMSFGRAGEGIYVYNFDDDMDETDDFNDGRFFIRGKYVGFTGSFLVGETILIPWIGYRAGKLKMALFSSLDAGHNLSSVYLGGLLRLGRGEIAIGAGAFVAPFSFTYLPGFLFGLTVMKKKIREVGAKRTNPFKLINLDFDMDVTDIRGHFFRVGIGIGDPFFGLGIRSRWTDEARKEWTYQCEMEGECAQRYLEDGKRINLTRFGKSTMREKLPDWSSPETWPVGTVVEFEKSKDRTFLAAFGSLIIPAGFCIARLKIDEGKIAIKVTKKKDDKIELQFTQNAYLEKGFYASVVELAGRTRSGGSSQSLCQNFLLDLKNEKGLNLYRDLVKNRSLPDSLLLDSDALCSDRSNEELLQQIEEDKEALAELGISRINSEWVRPDFRKRKYILGFQLLGIPGFSGERIFSEGPSKFANDNGVMERSISGYHQTKETPLARFSQVNSINCVQYFDKKDEAGDVISKFENIKGESSYFLSRIRGKKESKNIDKILEELDHYWPLNIENFSGSGRDRKLTMQVSLDKNDIDKIKSEPDLDRLPEILLEKHKKAKKSQDSISRVQIDDFLEKLTQTEKLDDSVQLVEEFLNQHRVNGIGILALLAGKEQSSIGLLTSSSSYDKPFIYADRFFLRFGNFTDDEFSLHQDLDVSHKRLLNKFYGKKLKILRKIDKALVELVGDTIAKTPDAMINVAGDKLSRDEVFARLWLLRRQVNKFSQELFRDCTEDEKAAILALVRKKNLDLESKIFLAKLEKDIDSPYQKFWTKKESKGFSAKINKEIEKLRDFTQEYKEEFPDFLNDYFKGELESLTQSFEIQS